MSSIEEIYRQVSSNLTVRYVMTPREEFVYYEDTGYEEYDIVPVRGDDGIRYYCEKGRKEKREIKPSDTICSNVGLIELIECLRKRRFFFVKDSDRIIGLVNISDLNRKAPLRLLLFTLILDIEVRLKEICSQIMPDDESIKECLAPSRWKRLRKERKKDKCRNVDVSIYEHFYLSDYFTLIEKSQELGECLCSRDSGISSPEEFIREYYDFVRDFRNRVAHPSRKSLVEEDKYNSDEEYIELLDAKIEKMRALQRLLANVMDQEEGTNHG